MVAVSLHVKASDPAIKLHREDVCQRILSKFSPALAASTADQRVLCLIDDEDFYPRKHGESATNRGNRFDVRGVYLPAFLPDYFVNLVLQVSAWPSLHREDLCDQVVYLHGSTCETDIGLTLTFAHELQHVVQKVSAPSLFEVNERLQERDQLWSHYFTEWWHLPVEI